MQPAQGSLAWTIQNFTMELFFKLRKTNFLNILRNLSRLKFHIANIVSIEFDEMLHALLFYARYGNPASNLSHWCIIPLNWTIGTLLIWKCHWWRTPREKIAKTSKAAKLILCIRSSTHSNLLKNWLIPKRSSNFPRPLIRRSKNSKFGSKRDLGN